MTDAPRQSPSQHLPNQPEEPRPARAIQRVTLWGLVANLTLSTLKFVFGIVGHSQALVADGVHSLSDSTTDLAILIGAPYWSAPADASHPYGHGRIETMITAAIGVVLGMVGIGLGYRAVVTFLEPHTTPPGWMAFAVACVSMVSKEALYRWTVRVGRRVRSSAVIANAWHHRSDGLSSLPVAIAVLGVRLNPEWTFLDHAGALIVSVLILQAAWHILSPTLQQLADAGLDQEERRKLADIAMTTDGVREVHALRSRQLGPGLQVDLHLLVDPDLKVREGHAIAHTVKDRPLNERPDIIDVLVHVEPYEPKECRHTLL